MTHTSTLHRTQASATVTRDLEELDYSYLADAAQRGQVFTGGYGPSFERCMQLVRKGLLAYHPQYRGALQLTSAGRKALAERGAES